MFKYFLIRIVTFFTIVILWYFSFWWCAIPLSIWYAYQFLAYELVVMGLLIDIEFSLNFDKPLYTFGFFALFIVMEWLKPRLRNRHMI